jgi:hypothetical protein
VCVEIGDTSDGGGGGGDYFASLEALDEIAEPTEEELEASSQRKAELKKAKRAAKKAAKGKNKNKSLTNGFHKNKTAMNRNVDMEQQSIGGFLDSIEVAALDNRTVVKGVRGGGDLTIGSDREPLDGDTVMQEATAVAPQQQCDESMSATQRRKEKRAKKKTAKRVEGGMDVTGGNGGDVVGTDHDDPDSIYATVAPEELDGEGMGDPEVVSATARKMAKRAAKAAKKEKAKKWVVHGVDEVLGIASSDVGRAHLGHSAAAAVGKRGSKEAALVLQGGSALQPKRQNKKKTKKDAAAEVERVLLGETDTDEEEGEDNNDVIRDSGDDIDDGGNDSDNSGGDEDDEEDWTDEEESDVDFENSPWVPEYTESLFDGHVSASFRDNVVYMWRKNNFSVPSAALLKDPLGLFSYLQEKVVRYHTCISCNRTFYSLEAVRGHMKDKSHRKTGTKGNDGTQELAEFYGASPTSARTKVANKKRKPKQDSPTAVTDLTDDGGVTDPTDDGGVSKDEDDVGEVTDEDAEDDDGTVATESTALDLLGNHNRVKRSAHVDDTGELVLGNGTRLGHRSMKRYYNQQYSEAHMQRASLARAASLQKLKGRVALREANKARNGMLVKAHMLAKGNSKALASQYAHKSNGHFNKHRQAILHHWGAGGGGSHYSMAGSRQYQKGVRVKGVVLRHSKQGARLQAARNKANRGNSSIAVLTGKGKK